MSGLDTDLKRLREVKQKWFTRAEAGLLAQNLKISEGPGGECVFRSRSTSMEKRCAVGHLMNDDEYNAIRAKHHTLPSCEPDNVVVFSFLADREQVEYSDAAIYLQCLQRCHDMSGGGDQMALRLVKFAMDNQLTVTPELTARAKTAESLVG